MELSVQTPLGTPSRLNLLMKLFLISQQKPKTWLWDSKALGVKSRAKWGNSDIPRFQYKDISLFHIKLKVFFWLLTLCERSKHFQSVMWTKLTRQVIELINTQFFQRPKTLIWDCIVIYCHLFYYNILKM